MMSLGGMLGVGSGGFNEPLLAVLLIWTLFWKGTALWTAAHRKEQWWFIGLLIINTIGILEILYLFVFTNEKLNALKQFKQHHS